MPLHLTDHKVNALNESLDITVNDEPGDGGYSHQYTIFIDENKRCDPKDKTVHLTIRFQNGPIDEVGINGISQEALAAIIIHRLHCFQKGQYACRENAIALTHFEEALMWLQKRTLKMIQLGVEGTSFK
jgi:hypothetical protein